MKDKSENELEVLLEKARFELQEIDSHFTASNADLKINLKSKAEKSEEIEWRVNAVQRKKEVCNQIRMLKGEIKSRHSEDGKYESNTTILKDIASKLDRIINLIT